MAQTYWRPIVQSGPSKPSEVARLAGGPLWFSHAQMLARGAPAQLVPVAEIPEEALDTLTRRRKGFCGLDLMRPQIMGILNVTPDSFSDGGAHESLPDAVTRAGLMLSEGADILDIGGESTRPGADFVSAEKEIGRTEPVIAAIKDADLSAPISIDTRKADVASRAVVAGAAMINDVSAGSFDPQMFAVAARLDVPICLMHASGDPKTMQKSPQYDDVLLDVYDYLQARRDAAVAAGIDRDKIILDPGIGFGKTVAHNLQLLRGLSLFHGLGCPLLLGVSRKRFIGTLTGAEDAQARAPGSIAVALDGLRQGVQIIRVHDVAQTRQAITMWSHLHL